MSEEASSMDEPPGSVGMVLIGWVIGPFGGIVIGELTGSMDGICLDTLTDVYIPGMFAVVIA